jgi:hypothetical protein
MTKLRLTKVASGLLLGILWLTGSLMAQDEGKISPPQIGVAVAYDTLAPIRDLAPHKIDGVESRLPALAGSVSESVGSKLQAHTAAGLQTANTAASKAPTTPGLNLAGVAGKGWPTADTSGAVGATQYVQWVNTLFAVYDKTTGALVEGPIAETTLWSGIAPCQSVAGDPSVQYDKTAGVWVMSVHSGGPTYYECFAVSTTSDATGSYTRYAFPLPSYNGTNYFPDYPKVGVWPDGYYVEFNLQNASTGFTPIAGMECAFDRFSMLAGTQASMVCFFVAGTGHDLTILPSDLDGATPPPAGAPNYFLQLNAANGALNLWQFHVDWTTLTNSTFTGPTAIAVGPIREACNGGKCIPQLNSTQHVDGVGDRLMNRVAYRNFGTYDVIVATHSVTVTNPARTGIRWYEIRNPGGTPVVHQAATWKPDANFRWLGSIGMDKLGDIAVGYNVSSTTMYPAVRYAARLAAYPINLLQSEMSIVEGTGSQQPGNNSWADVSTLSIDPVDDCTFWYSSQYYQTSSVQSWSTRIGSFSFAGCN